MTDLTIGRDLQTFADALKNIDRNHDNDFVSIKKTGFFFGKTVIILNGKKPGKNQEKTIAIFLSPYQKK